MLKTLMFIFFYLILFLRVWVPLLFILSVKRWLQMKLEFFLIGKQGNAQKLFSPFGSFFFPLIAYSFRIIFGSPLVFCWLKPVYNHKLENWQNTLIAISGPVFHLGVALSLLYIDNNVLKLTSNIDSNIFLWMLLPFIKIVISQNLLLALVNVLPFYPFDFSKLFAKMFFNKDENLFFIFKLVGLITTIILFSLPQTWHLIDKVIGVCMSLYYR